MMAPRQRQLEQRPVSGNDRIGRVRWSLRDTGICMALLAAFLVSRCLWIATHPESSSYWEEAYRGVAVEQLASGAELPLSDYQADHYQGGSLVVIVLASALRVLGVDSFVALKAVALLFSGGTLVALYLLGRVLFGSGVALLCGSIYLLGPPLVAFWGVVAMGFHAESALLSLCVVGVFLALVEDLWSGTPAWLGFGFVSGIALWFTPTAGITLAACVLAWPWLAKRPTASNLLVAAVGFGFGLVPWFAYNLAHDFAGLDRILEVFGARSAPDSWRSQGLGARAADLLLRAPTEGLLDPGGDRSTPWPAYFLFAGVWLPAGVALVAAMLRGIRVALAQQAEGESDARREFVFLVYALVFTAIYLASRFTLDIVPTPIGYRLIVPLAIFLIPPIAVSAVRGLRAGGIRSQASLLGCAVALFSLGAATWSFARSHSELGTPLSLERGHVVWGRLLHNKNSRDVGAAIGAAGRIATGADRDRMLTGIGWGMEHSLERWDNPDLSSSLQQLPSADAAKVARGLTWALSRRRSSVAAALSGGEDADLRALLVRLDTLTQRFAALAGERPTAEKPISVVLISLDTTRADHLSCYGYERETTPQLDALAARAVRYRHAWSTSSWTLPAHASLFTGLFPSRHAAHYDPAGDAALGAVLKMPAADQMKVGKLSDDITTLAEMLAAAGYRTGAFVAGPWLHRGFGLLQGFEVKDDATQSFGGRPAHEITDSAIAWVRTLEPDESYLLFANYFDPHAPYTPTQTYPDLPRASEPFAPSFDELMRGESTLDDDERAVLRDRYDAEIRIMDAELGRLLEEVSNRPGGERSLIIVTADHGEALGDEGRFGHGFWLSQELLHVPLIVRFPFDRDGGSWNDETVQLVDVLPLIAGELGMSAPEGIEGVAVGEREVAFAELYREASAVARFGSRYERDLQAAIGWPHKLVRADDGSESWVRLSQPGVGDREPAGEQAKAALSRALDQHTAGKPARPVVAPEVDPATFEALRELGYVE